MKILFSSCLCAVALAQLPSNEAQEAQVLDVNEECTPQYDLEPFASLVPFFPPVWEIASILQADTNAQALYNQIAPGIPDIAPRGVPLYDPGPFIANYSSDDPDCWWTATQCTHPKVAGLPDDITQCNYPDVLGLAFDDGPNCSHNAFYDYLQEQDQKATLFYIGSNVLDWPLQAQRGLDDGHIICDHTWSHRAMCALTNEQVFAEFYYSLLAIKAVTGVTPTCWRPPFGDVDDRVRYIANALGLRNIQWNANTFDFYVSTLGPATVNANYAGIVDDGKNGTYASYGPVLEAHELNNLTMGIFESNYEALSGAFQQIQPVHACIDWTQPYYEKQYVYPSHEQYSAGTKSISAYTATATVMSALTSLSSYTATSTISASITVSNNAGSNPTAVNVAQHAVQAKSHAHRIVPMLSITALLSLFGFLLL